MIPQELINRLCQIPIADYLASKGHYPMKQKGQQLLYRSPLRPEKTPSFYVHLTKNVWNDFGGDKGSLIRLVRVMDNCDFISAISTLQQFVSQPSSFTNAFSFSDPILNKSLKEKETILAVKLHENKALVDYPRSRHISYPTARKYLRDVYYSSANRRLFAIGFENDKGGFVLRNQWTDQTGTIRQTKRNIGPTWYTTVDGPNMKALNLFEGVFDFLSALDYYKVISPSCRTIVLNSTTNLEAVLPALTGFSQINAYLDNDQAGRTALSKLQASGLCVSDRSSIYQGYKDFNEFWISQEISKI